MKIIKFLLTLVVTLGLVHSGFSAAVVFAQEEEPAVRYKNVHLWVNPEYDDPGLLVMLQGQIDGVTAPVTVRFMVPSTAQMYSAGSIDASGQYSGGPPARVPSAVAGWDEISYTLQTDTFRVEYYDNIIQGLPDKTISYEFRWVYPITHLAALIQEPRNSSNYSITPAGSITRDSENFNVHTYSYVDLDTEEPLRFNISYTKADNVPSLSAVQSTSSGTSNTTLLFVIPFLLIALIVGIVWWSTNSKQQKKRRNQKAASGKATGGPKRKSGFCPGCGEPVQSTKFCPNCGTKL